MSSELYTIIYVSRKDSLVYAADSLIHGKGLFARKHIGAGELIGVLDGAPTSTDGEHVLWLDAENGFHVFSRIARDSDNVH